MRPKHRKASMSISTKGIYARNPHRIADVAFHEAGHFVSGLKMFLYGQDDIDSVTVESEEYGNFGYVKRRVMKYEIYREMVRDNPKFRRHHRRHGELNVIQDLAGYASEWRRKRIPLRGQGIDSYEWLENQLLEDEDGGDLRRALDRLEVFEPTEQKRMKWFHGLWERTWKLVGKWWPDIERVAGVLLEKKTLKGKALGKMCDSIEPDFSVLDKKQRKGKEA